LKNTLSLSTFIDISLSISTSHITSTPSAFDLILQITTLTRYINCLLTYVLI